LAVALFLALQKKTHPAEEVKKLRSAPEEPHPDMVIFSTPHLSLKAEHEPLYWNWLNQGLGRVRAFHVLFITSVATLLSELILAAALVVVAIM
jgi:hypothetical protein